MNKEFSYINSLCLLL